MPQPDAALLFAAGFGTRMAPLTDTRPKPLIEVAGKPLFDHALTLVQGTGIRRVGANTHYLAPMMARHLAERGVTESHEPKILDTGGGLKRASQMLDAPVMLTLNTDAVWTGANPVPALLDHWNPDNMDALLLLIHKDRATGHRGAGDFAMGDCGRLVWGPDLIYTGLQILKTDAFQAETDTAFPMRRIWERLVSAGRVRGLLHRGGWCDVGRPESIPLAEAMLGATHV